MESFQHLVITGSLKVSGTLLLNGESIGSGSSGGTGFPYSGSAIITGSLLLSGSQSITGSLNTLGSQTITGSLNLSGSQVITGSLAVSGNLIGPVNISGSLSVNGVPVGSATVLVSGSAPSGSQTSGSLWWNNEDGNLYIQSAINSGSSWVPAVTSVAGGNYGATYRNTYSASIWTVTHNLGTAEPIIQVYSGSQMMIPASIMAQDTTTSIITFASITSGSVIASTGVGGITTASFALMSATADSSSYALNSTSASYALSSSYTLNATSASYASSSRNATSASYLFQTGSYGKTTIDSNNFTASIQISGSNTIGGVKYLDFLRVSNATSGATAPNKSFRLNELGGFEIINSAYSSNIFYLTDSGSVALTGAAGYVTMPNRPAFRVYGATNNAYSANTVISGSAMTLDYSQGTGWNIATGTFTAPVAGLYQVNLVARINGTGAAQAIVRKNSGGTLTNQIMIEWASNTTANHIGGSTITKLAVSDTLQVVCTLGAITFDSNDNFSVAYIG